MTKKELSPIEEYLEEYAYVPDIVTNLANDLGVT